MIKSEGGVSFERTSADMVAQIAAVPVTADYYVLIFTDVTALRRSEQTARDHAARLGAIMDNVPDAIMTINPSGSIESWSEGAVRIFGYSADEILRRSITALIPAAAADDQSFVQRHLDGQAINEPPQRQQLEARHRDGHLFPIDLAFSDMHIGSRRLLVCVARDITDQRIVEQMKSEFIATVSHELRTPLTSIAGSLGLLPSMLTGNISEKAQRLLTIAQNNSERLARLINDILDLEKSEACRLELKLKPTSLSALAEQAIEANRGYAERYQVQFTLTGGDGGHLVAADADRMMQVFSNLLSNAAKYSPPGGQVEISIHSLEGQVRVTVRDHGQGIPPDFQARIFSRFAQADASDSRQKGGSGLGLAITKSLVERHHGHIGFDSRHASAASGSPGTAFWFELAKIEVDDSETDMAAYLTVNC